MPTTPAPSPTPTVDHLVACGLAAGLHAVGVAPAEPFEGTRAILHERKAAGLHGGMNFTYRNPDRSTEPARALEGARALVVGAYSYLRDVPERPGSVGPQGRVARYSWSDYYQSLRDGLTAIADELRSHGWAGRVLADDNALVDREAARRAGLGWYGKNANLLLSGAGSWFVLGSVVTDAPLPTSAPDDLPADGCGPCSRCLDGCPTGAIVAPGVVDARSCLAWLVQAEGMFPREHRAALGDRIYGCDDCQEVCPPNRVAIRRYPGDGEPTDDPDGKQATVDLLAMLDLDDEALLREYGRWYIPRREARYLRRNVLLALGNVARPDDAAAAAALARALADPDPVVRGHAVWAARRLGRHDLLDAATHLSTEHDPQVLEELNEPVTSRA